MGCVIGWHRCELCEWQWCATVCGSVWRCSKQWCMVQRQGYGVWQWRVGDKAGQRGHLGARHKRLVCMAPEGGGQGWKMGPPQPRVACTYMFLGTHDRMFPRTLGKALKWAMHNPNTQKSTQARFFFFKFDTKITVAIFLLSILPPKNSVYSVTNLIDT